MKFYNYDDSESVSKVKDILDTKYSTDFKRTKEFSVFDLRDDNTKIMAEVKKRNNTKDKYPTTMVGENKFLKAKEYYERGYDVLFCFEFTDGIYYYEYCNEKLETKLGGRRDRDRPEFKNYVYIPVSKLKRLSPTNIKVRCPSCDGDELIVLCP
jgi:hypothetical protein